ncbi:MAG: ABC transporter ATP-binding protein [Lautropia sp.]
MTLKVDRLSRSFDGLRAVADCSFEVRPGTITALIGPNGAGKTTVFNLIAGFLRPDAGAVWFRGRRIDGLAPHRIARHGVVRAFQIPRDLRTMTVVESLKLVPPGQIGESPIQPFLRWRRIREQEAELAASARRTLALVGLSQMADAEVRTLSGGQKKLWELARVLMSDAPMILLDEPAAGVNPALLQRIGEIVQQACRSGRTILLVEHNMKFVRTVAQHVIVMAEGTVLVEGPFSEIVAHPAVARAYLGRAA